MPSSSLLPLPRLKFAVGTLLTCLFALFWVGGNVSAVWAQDVPAAPSPQPPSISTLPATSPVTYASAPQPAQPQAVHMQDYSIPRSAFPHILQPYRPQELGPTQPGQLAAH